MNNGYFFETEFWKILLRDDQRYLGSLIIKTKVLRESLSQVTTEEQFDFFLLIAKLESFYKEKIGATMFNYSCLMNHAYRDNETPHVHYHFRPRYRNPVTILGKTFSDPNFGEHYLDPALYKNNDTTVPDDVRNYIKEELKKYLEQNI